MFKIRGSNLFHEGWLAAILGQQPTLPERPLDQETYMLGYTTATDTGISMAATVLAKCIEKGQIIVEAAE